MGCCSNQRQSSPPPPQLQNGVIWNDSQLEIEYLVYSGIQKLVKKTITYEDNPQLKLTTDGLLIKGIQHKQDKKMDYQFQVAVVKVNPGTTKNTGLTKALLNKSRLSIRVNVNNYYLYFMTDVPITQLPDMWIKIGNNFVTRKMLLPQAYEKNGECYKTFKKRAISQQQKTQYQNSYQQLLEAVKKQQALDKKMQKNEPANK